MPREKKYLKLEAGERRAVRQSGAMKEARKTGTKTNIYSGNRGSLMGTNTLSSNDPQAKTRTKSTTLAGNAKGGTTSEATRIQNADIYKNQSMINQKEFEKTRLGSRMVKKAEKAQTRGKAQEGSEYKPATPKPTPLKKQIRVAGSTKGGMLKSDLKPTLAQKREAKRVEKQIKDVKKVKNKRGIN